MAQNYQSMDSHCYSVTPVTNFINLDTCESKIFVRSGLETLTIPEIKGTLPHSSLSCTTS
jgi:hypothetical protein